MKKINLIILLFVLVSVLFFGCANKNIQGSYKVSTATETLIDDTRNREIPIKVYYPKTEATDEKFPVIIFSHGLGGTCTGYSYLGYYWASFGYVVIMPQHKGSDFDALKHRAKNKELSDPKYNINGTEELFISNRINRPKDASFVVDMLEGDKIKAEKLSKICNLKKIGIAGHSYGAYTTMTIAGTLIDFTDEENKSFRDERFIAAIAMSPQYIDSERPNYDLVTGELKNSEEGKQNEGFGLNEGAWEKVELPIFLMFGELEGPDWHNKVYESVKSKEKFNMMIKRATHMVFSDSVLGSRYRDDAHLGYIQVATLKFWDAYLKDDAEAKKFLTENKISEISQNQCNIEHPTE